MKTQSDQRIRVVSLCNLKAMCSRISGTCHTFTVSKVTRSRVHVEYSNPSEHGTPNPVTAVYPCYPCTGYDNEDNPMVVLDTIRVLNDQDDGACQAFDQLEDCEKLWRDPTSGQWSSEFEILRLRHPSFAVTSSWDKDGCIQTWTAMDGCNALASFNNWREAQAYAVEQMRKMD